MDTKKLNALITIIDKGSLTAASEALGYTQPGLTNMMKSLEDELGITLLIRGKTGVHLTAAGAELRPDIEALLAAADTLAADAENIRQKSMRTLHVGAISSVARNWLPTILAEFKSEFPGTEVFITRHDVIKPTYDAVRNSELDCAFISYQKDLAAGLSWFSLGNDELVAVLPFDYRTHNDTFAVEDFRNADFFMPSGGFDLDVLPIFENCTGSDAPNIHYSNLDDASILSMVSHGLGVSIMSDLVVEGLGENVKTLPLEPPHSRELGIIVRNSSLQDKNIRNFIRCAVSTVSGIRKKRF